jgi:hypothetical protein
MTVKTMTKTPLAVPMIDTAEPMNQIIHDVEWLETQGAAEAKIKELSSANVGNFVHVGGALSKIRDKIKAGQWYPGETMEGVLLDRLDIPVRTAYRQMQAYKAVCLLGLPMDVAMQIGSSKLLLLADDLHIDTPDALCGPKVLDTLKARLDKAQALSYRKFATWMATSKMPPTTDQKQAQLAKLEQKKSAYEKKQDVLIDGAHNGPMLGSAKPEPKPEPAPDGTNNPSFLDLSLLSDKDAQIMKNSINGLLHLRTVYGPNLIGAHLHKHFPEWVPIFKAAEVAYADTED